MIRTAFFTVLVLLFPLGVHAEYHPVESSAGMVVSAHPKASEAGITILKANGNAVDATVAAAFALAVVEPYGSGLGGGGFTVLWEKGKATALDFRERAPAASFRDMYITDGKVDPEKSRTGPHSVAIPGMVKGLWDLHRKHGFLPWHDLLAPAITLAEEGFLVNHALASRIQQNEKRFNPAAKAIFMPGGQVPRVGTELVQKDLAKTLRALAKTGPAPFYDGPIAKWIVETIQGEGGKMTLQDLQDYETRWRTPITGEYRGITVHSMPPPSSGGIHLIQMLNILSNYDLKSFGYASSRSVHFLTEVMKFAFADRSKWLGDPDFYDVPVARLLSSEHLDKIHGRIQEDRAIPAEELEGSVLPDEPGNTSHLSVIDKDGNAVASTLTINLTFGSAMVAAHTGIVLNDEMDDFAAAPGAPNAFGLLGSAANAVAPGKRPLSSMTPTICEKNGKVFLIAGSPGGSRIITTTLQVILHVVDYGMNIAEAVFKPRVHHQWYPRAVFMEPYGLSQDTQKALKALGHTLQETTFMGNAQAIYIDPKTDIRFGASDPRGMGKAMGY